MVTPQDKNTCPGGHEINNFGRPFLGYHYYMYILSLSEPCPGIETIFFKYIIFTFLPQNYLPLGWGVGGHEIYNFLFPYHKDATYEIWLRWSPIGHL